MSRQPRQNSSVSGASPRFASASLVPRRHGELGEPLVDELFDGVFDNPAGELGRRVVDAKLLALDRLGHWGVTLGLFGVAEDAGRFQAFEFRDRTLEQVAQHVEIDFVGEVVARRSC